jgi:uncharacterized damage-inducible protein DinB
MTSPDFFARMFEFHRWRVEQVVAELGALPDATLDAPIHGSFTTIRKLMQHVVWVDQLWVARVQGLPNPPIASAEAMTWAALLQTWRGQAAWWQAFVVTKNSFQLAAVKAYVSVTLGPKEHPLADLLFQAQDHTGYHLGQLAHALRQLGLKPMSVGYAAWLWR